MNDAIRTQISAFVDGELPDAEADLLLRRMSQDASLRRQAAEYLEIGRAMRGEPGVPGVERLQERISAALDDKPLAADEAVPEVPAGRSIKPLAGAAVAAAVALLAIVSLQFSPGLDGTDVAPPADVVAGVSEGATYVVPPRPVDDQLRQYVLSHGASASELGGNSMNTRLVTLRLSEEALAEEEPADETTDDEAANETPTQP